MIVVPVTPTGKLAGPRAKNDGAALTSERPAVPTIARKVLETGGLLGPRLSVIGAVNTEGKDARPRPPPCHLIATRVTLTGNAAGRNPKSSGAARMKTRHVIHTTAARDWQAGECHGLNQNARGVVTNIIKDAQLQPHLCRMIVTQVFLIGKLGGQSPKSIGAALTSREPAIHTIVRKALETGDFPGPKQSAPGAVTIERKDARPRPHLCLMIATRVSLTGKLAGRTRKKNGVALMKEKPVIHMIVRKAMEAGKPHGVRPSNLGVVKGVVKDVRQRQLLCLMIAMQGLPIGKLVGQDPRNAGAALTQIGLVIHTIVRKALETG